MNLDDETYLSAYLDDELDPADRLAIEWSVESSPPLAEQLRSIAQARDAVAGLDRPAIPRDLASSLVARLAADRRRARLREFARPARVALAASSLSAVAASLIFAIILLNRILHDSPIGPDVAVEPKSNPAPRTHPISPSDPAPTPTEVVSTDPAVPLRQPDTRSSNRPEVASTPPAEARDLGYRRLIARMLERPRVRRIVIVTDVLDAPNRVQELIRDDARQTPEFGRISICQDIVIDPDRAEAAEVFAVPMDERVRRSFVDRLRRQFPQLVEEGESKPELVMQLGEVGQVVVIRGAEAAPLGEPPDDVRSFIANRADTPPDHIVDPKLGHFDPIPPDHHSPIAKVGSPELRENLVGVVARESRAMEGGSDFVGPPDLDRMAPPKPGEPLTLLVWVTRPAKH